LKKNQALELPVMMQLQRLMMKMSVMA